MSDTYGETVKGMLADAAGALKRDSAPTCPFCGSQDVNSVMSHLLSKFELVHQRTETT